MSSIITIPTEFPERSGSILPSDAHTITVDSQFSYERACGAVKEIKAVRRQIEADRKQLKEGVLKAGRAIDDKARSVDAPWKAAEDALTPRITAYLDEQERLRKEEQRRLEEAARRQAEEEQLAAAEAAAKSGASEAEVDAILTEEPPPPPMPVAPAPPRVAGISTPQRWGAEVTDKAAFLRWVVAEKQWELAEAVMPRLNAMATAQRQNLRIPGVRALPKRHLRTGR